MCMNILMTIVNGQVQGIFVILVSGSHACIHVEQQTHNLQMTFLSSKEQGSNLKRRRDGKRGVL